MITIEVLVAMLILFLVSATSFEYIKFFNIISEKKEHYEDVYIATLNIKDELSSDICKKVHYVEGVSNSYTYSAQCEKIKELRTYVKAIEYDDESGNIGGFMIELYRVNLELKNVRFHEEMSYYVTREKKSAPL